MKATNASVIVSKKISQQFNSWSVSYGVNGTLEEGEDYQTALVETEKQLRSLLSEQLPTPEAVHAEITRINTQAIKKSRQKQATAT